MATRSSGEQSLSETVAVNRKARHNTKSLIRSGLVSSALEIKASVPAKPVRRHARA
jgi:hypothetical protein